MAVRQRKSHPKQAVFPAFVVSYQAFESAASGRRKRQGDVGRLSRFQAEDLDSGRRVPLRLALGGFRLRTGLSMQRPGSLYGVGFLQITSLLEEYQSGPYHPCVVEHQQGRLGQKLGDMLENRSLQSLFAL